jgi:hypothetical protein
MNRWELLAEAERRENELLTLAQERILGFSPHKPFTEQVVGIAQWRVTQVRAAMEELIAFCLEHGEPYRARVYLGCLGERHRLRSLFANGIQDAQGNPDFDRYMAAMEAGTTLEQERYTRDYVPKKSIDAFRGSPFGQVAEWQIKEGLLAYQRKHQVPQGMYHVHGADAAGELHARSYDLAIGVCRRGTAVASLMEMLGSRVRYAEWHADWTVPPRWRKAGTHTDRVRQADRVLVCEHDTAQGRTLRALRPFIDKLNPTGVDVHFIVDIGGRNPSNMAAHTPDWHHVTEQEIERNGNIYVHCRTILARLRELECLPEDAPSAS